MPHDRFYHHTNFQQDLQLSLKESELHHLHVQKVRVGDKVEVVNGHNQLAFATVTLIEKHQAILHIDRIQQDNGIKPVIILAQAIPKMNHLEWIIEKGVELGVTSFWLFPGLYSEKSDFSENQRKRLDHLMLAAMKQCGRLDLPQIELKPILTNWSMQRGYASLWRPSPHAPFLWTLKPPLPQPVTLVIGPERGLHAQEIAHLKSKLHAQGVKLHPNTLRTETASLVALSLLQCVL